METKKPRQRLRPKPTPAIVEAEASKSNSPNGSGTQTPTQASSSLPQEPSTSTSAVDIDGDLAPSGKYTEYQIVSTASKGWKYNIMKFAESKDKEIELTKWRQPIKLNRKDYRPPDRGNLGLNSNGSGAGDEGEDTKNTPMLGLDGKPVVGFDGRIVMVGPDGKVIPPSGTSKGSTNGGSSKPGSKAGTPNGKSKPKNMNRKKIKQVFLVPEETRKLRREERYPWVIEEAPLETKPVVSNGDSTASTSSASTIPGQIWIGHLENPEKNQTHAFLIPSGSTFQFVCSHRFYKFTKRRLDVPGAEEAEAEYAKLQKSKDPAQLWKRRKGALSEATLSTLTQSVKNEDGDDYDSGRRGMDGEDDIFGGDDDEEEKILKKRRNRDLGQEGDMDEMEYEEEFADDDEKIEMDGEDEEMKEMEERLKREYRTANKARDATIDDDEEDEEMEEINQLTGAGRDLKKIVKRNEKNEVYDSDEEEGNPYASEEEEEEQPPPPILDGPAVMNQQQQSSSTNNAPPSTPPTPTPTPTASTTGAPPARPPPTTTLSPPQKQLPHVSSTSSSSRPGSPLAGGLPPGMGNAIVAKRATSPKGGKSRPLGANGSASGIARSPSPSPLGGGGGVGGSKAGVMTPTGGRSPVASRAGSPVAISTGGNGISLKRKAPDEGPASPVSPTSAGAGASTDPSAANKPRKKPKRPLDEAMIISFLREKKEVTTKDCIQRFQPYLREEETKKAFTAMVKKVAVAKNNILILKEEYA